MAAVYLLFISSCLLQWSGGNASTPVVYPFKSLPSSQCVRGQSNPIQDDQQLKKTLKMIHQQLLTPGCHPPQNCSEILRCNSSASSGYYQIQAVNGSALQVYCDMEGTHCGEKGGWMRVARLNMTQPSSQCPVGFRVQTANKKSFCIRDTRKAGCGSMLFEPFGLTYSQVCGYVRGYSFSSIDAFAGYSSERTGNEPLSGNYVDGVSITYGTPPTHIWTYAAGSEETGDFYENHCPCNNFTNSIPPPTYVGNDYYCESGTLNNQHKWHIRILCGMVCSVEEMRDLVVTTLDCPGLTRTHPHPPLPLSKCVSVWMRVQTMRILE